MTQRGLANNQVTKPELHLLTGADTTSRPDYTYQPRTSGLPQVAVFDNDYAPTLAFLASLGSKGVGMCVYGVHGLAITRWSRYCSKFTRCPPPDYYVEFVPWLRDKLRSGEITRVAPTSDLIIYYMALLRDEFPADVQRSIPRLAEVENCLIKSRFHAICNKRNLPTPQTYTPVSIEEALNSAEQLGYPLMLKPKSHLVVGMAERGRVIHSAEELRKHFHAYDVFPGHEPLAILYPELRWPMIQKYIASDGQRVYSVSGIKDANMGIAAAAVSYKREQWPPFVGTSMAQVSCENETVLTAGLRTVEALLTRGIFEIELITDGNELLAIDLNPRGFGFMALDTARGNDLAWLWLQTTLAPITRDHNEIAGLHLECRSVVPYYLSRLLCLFRGPERRRMLADFWRERHRPSIAMTGSWSDPVPALLARLLILFHPYYLLRTSWAVASKLGRRQKQN